MLHIRDGLLVPQPFNYANTVEYRAKHLSDFFSSKTNVAWCLRGGRGGSAVVEQIPHQHIPQTPKLIVGFSDATALHLLTLRWGWPFLHASVLAFNKEVSPEGVNKESSLKNVVDILTGQVKEVQYAITPANNISKSLNEPIDSSIVGGNMSAIQRSIGTYTHLNAANKILLLEDIGEEAGKVMEVFTQFERSGLFNNVRGVILGNFISTFKEQKSIDDFHYVFAQLGKSLDHCKIPMFTSDRFGHGPYNDPLPLNTPARILLENPEIATLNVKTNN